LEKSSLFTFLAILFFTWGALGFSDPTVIRWTGDTDHDADLAHLVDVLNSKTGLTLKAADFSQFEDRDLAHNHFRMYIEQAAGVPLESMAIRVWTSLTDGSAIQVEGMVSKLPSKIAQAALAADQNFDSQQTMALVRSALIGADDGSLVSVKWKDMWENDKIVRQVKVKARHGVHTLKISLRNRNVAEKSYRSFPQSDEFSVPVQIYNIYEEVAGTGQLLARIPSELRYLETKVPRVTADPYGVMRSRRYFDDKQDPVLGLTPQGVAQGFWAMSALKAQALGIFSNLPMSDNVYTNGGVILQGRYATVNLNPLAAKSFTGLSFTPQLSAVFKPDYRATPENPNQQELYPTATLIGRPLQSAADAYGRVARKLPDNDTVSLMNDGFDEIQVYWSVNQLFESLHGMGFTDPELSTRRFNAFLYDPDIEYRDNAFYTDDTINFTTYSSINPNEARDNSTIWHELGHGVMDRLMGDEIQLADTGGLSEGMADFVAQMVLNDVTGGADYPGKSALRIFNNTGFYLTNEVHDDGEAYGGTMNDLLQSSMEKWGRPGLTKVVDLTLETMRFTRNHPALTAVDWFNHMLFADSLGSAGVRLSNELHDLIEHALDGRNFNLDGGPTASFVLKNGSDEVVSTSAGARNSPIKVKIADNGSATYHLTVNLKSSPTYKFKYPVSVKVGLRGGPLQGAIHWVGKATSPVVYTLASETDTLAFNLTANGKCDAINKTDGTCVDYASIQIWNQGETQNPQAKRRFYLNITK
jgi:hypothetical protein